MNLHASRSSLNQVEPVIAMSKNILVPWSNPTPRISPIVSVEIVETTLTSLMSDETKALCRGGASGVSSREESPLPKTPWLFDSPWWENME